jgi:hypothetical protein
MAHKIRDHSLVIPIVLFIALAGVVTYSIMKGNREVVLMKEDVMYVHPVSEVDTSKLN